MGPIEIERNYASGPWLRWRETEGLSDASYWLLEGVPAQLIYIVLVALDVEASAPGIFGLASPGLGPDLGSTSMIPGRIL